MSQENKDYLDKFTLPVYQYTIDNNKSRLDYLNEQNRFLTINENLEPAQFISLVKQTYGEEAALYERYYQFKYTRGIFNMLKFFVILTVLSIISAIIVAIVQFV